MSFFHQIYEWATRNPVSRFDDPVLGELIISDTGWECTLPSPTGLIVFTVGGRYEPDDKLLKAAHEAYHQIDVFIARVADYLREESIRPQWQQFAEEIAHLSIAEVSYWWARQPNCGMIYFHGPDECKLWHCDIKDLQPFGLAFDS